MIEIKHLKFGYPNGGFLLQVPDLVIGKDQRAAAVGPSGTGKTTLINLIAGILPPHEGQIAIDGIELTQYGAEDRQDLRIVKMGLIFQEFELLEYLDVFNNILLPYRISPVLELNEESRERARSLIQQVGLESKLSRLPGQLSQGERQRVAVCRALVTQPSLLLCDEPTGNLDPENRDQVLDILFNYCEERQAPMIVVTHDQEIMDRFNRIIKVKEFVS